MRRLRWTWPSLAVLIWGGVVLGISVNAFFHPRSHSVFPIYALAAKHWWAGQDLYAPSEDDIDFFRYSPLYALAMTPLAYLPAGWGSALWKGFNGLFFLVSLWSWARRAVPEPLRGTGLALFFLLALPVSLTSLNNGQANLIMVGACLLGLTAAAEERWNGAAGWLALAAYIKIYALGLGLVLAVLHPRRLAGRLAAVMAAGLLLPFAAQHPGVVLRQYQSWFQASTNPLWIMRARLRSFDYLLHLHHYPLSQSTFSRLGFLTAGLVLVLCCWQAWWRKAPPRVYLTRLLALFMIWVVLFGPATESCTYAVLAPSLAWSLVDAFRRPRGWISRMVVVSGFLLVGPCLSNLCGPTVGDFIKSQGHQPLGALLFLGHWPFLAPGLRRRDWPVSWSLALLPGSATETNLRRMTWASSPSTLPHQVTSSSPLPLPAEKMTR